MEQGNCLDSTRMSAVQEVETRTDGEPALDAAITNLLQAPTRATASEPVSAARPQDDVPDLADACIEQVARLDRWDADTGSLTEEEGEAEMKRWEAVFRRAIETPSAGLRDLAGKAHLMLADLERFHPLTEESTDDARLMRVILSEAMSFGGLATKQEGAALPIACLGSRNTASPVLSALVNEWCELQAYMTATVPMENDELDAKLGRANELQESICAFEVRSVADLAAKLPILRDAHAEIARFQADTLDEVTWRSALRDIETLAGQATLAVQADPALAVIEEGRRLLRAYLDAHHIYKQDPTTIDPRPEWGEAGRALWAYVDETILQTAPLTAAGCRDLARFGVEYADAMECSISDDDEQAISRLIAQSPLLVDGTENAKAGSVFALAKADAEALGLSGMGIGELGAFYDKLRAARELWGAAMCEPVAEASRSTQGFVVRSHYGSRAEFEDVRAGFLMDRVATEIANRPAINDWERDNQLALRIQQEIACEGRIQDPALVAEIARTWG